MNFPGTAVAALTDAGHDVVWIRTTAPGLADVDVLAAAARENRILLTFDKDFGQLTRDATLPRSCGVVLFRMAMPRAAEVGTRLAAIIGERQDWVGQFSVVTSARVRMRRLP